MTGCEKNEPESDDWARLGNAFAQFADDEEGLLTRSAINRSESALYAAAAFYSGGFPASAYLSIRRMQPIPENGTVRACYDLLARPVEPLSEAVRRLLLAVRSGNNDVVAEMNVQASQQAAEAFGRGPDEWVPARLYAQLMRRFASVNLRAVLPPRPDGFWNSLVDSLIRRSPSTWEFFLRRSRRYEDICLMTIPVSRCKCRLALVKQPSVKRFLFDHLLRHPFEAAILLVPYRSLASELRVGLVRQLNGLGISSRCAYGGTVPSGDEVRDLGETQLLSPLRKHCLAF